MVPKDIRAKDRLIFAMDVPDCDRARSLADDLGDAVTFYKIGLELMMSGGYFELLDWLLERDKKVFCDLKFFDIPATVGSAVRQLKDRGAGIKFPTNSLTPHDVPAVNSHYKQWRIPFIEAGAELCEVRHDAEIQPLVCDTLPTRAEFTGLHSNTTQPARIWRQRVEDKIFRAILKECF